MATAEGLVYTAQSLTRAMEHSEGYDECTDHENTILHGLMPIRGVYTMHKGTLSTEKKACTKGINFRASCTRIMMFQNLDKEEDFQLPSSRLSFLIVLLQGSDNDPKSLLFVTIVKFEVRHVSRISSIENLCDLNDSLTGAS